MTVSELKVKEDCVGEELLSPNNNSACSPLRPAEMLSDTENDEDCEGDCEEEDEEEEEGRGEKGDETDNNDGEEEDDNFEDGTTVADPDDDIDDDDGNDNDSEYEINVPDGGWGWVICFGSFMVNFILDGTMLSFGILLLDLLKDFGTSKGTTTWAGSALLGFSMIMGPGVSYLLQRYSIRQVTIAGSILSLLAFVGSVFSPNVYVLIFTYGVLGGCGFSMIFLPAIIVVGLYFNKKRAIATGIATSGSGLGTFAYAYITNSLLSEYNWRGTVLILAGLVFNCAVCGALFRPLLPTACKENKKIVKFLEAKEKAKCRAEDVSSATSGYSSDNLHPDSPKRGVREMDGSQSIATQTADNESTVTFQDDQLVTPIPIRRHLPGNIGQQRGKAIGRGGGGQKHPGGKMPQDRRCKPAGGNRNTSVPLVEYRSVSQYCIDNNNRVNNNRIDTGSTNRLDTSFRSGYGTHLTVDERAQGQGHSDNDSVLSRRLLPKASPQGMPGPSHPNASPLDRIHPRDNVSVHSDAYISANAATKTTRNLEVPETTSFVSRLRVRSSSNCKDDTVSQSDVGSRSVKIVVSGEDDDDRDDNVNEDDKLSQALKDGSCSQRESQLDLQGKGMESAADKTYSLARLLQPVAFEYNPSGSPFGRPYQSADHLYHLTKALNPMYDNGKDVSSVANVRMLNSDYQLHGLDGRGHPIKGQRSPNFDQSALPLSRRSSQHSQISKGLLRPLLRKDIYYSGSVNHLPDYQRLGSVTTFMAAMTRSSLQDKVDVISLLDDPDTDCCPKRVKTFLPWYLFRKPVFILLIITFTTWTAHSVTMTYLPDLAVSMGISRADAAFLISIIGISNILGRLLAGFVTDCLRISSIFLYCIALTLASATNLVFALGGSYEMLCAACVVFGLCMGVAVAMRTIVLTEQLGIELLTQSFGIVALFQGLAFTVNPPIAGILCDDLDSFTPPFYMTSLLYAISGISCVVITIMGRTQRKKQLRLIRMDEISLQSQSDIYSLNSYQPSNV